MNRKEYMDGTSKSHDAWAWHRQYYAQFVTPALIQYVVRFIGEERIKRSTDKAMNDIPLGHWDSLHQSIVPMVRSKARELGEGVSLGTSVCIAKEAARQWKDENDLKQIVVNYHRGDE